MRARVPLILLLVCVALIMPLSAFGKRPKVSPVVAKFGGECDSTAFRHSSRLEQLIRKTRERVVSPCNSPLCDGAFAHDLSGDGRSEYFVRLGCGATGNCTWGIFSDRPARLRGTFTAWFFYIHKRSGHWSKLSTYTRQGGDRGVIGSLANHKGKYVLTSERTEQGDYDDPQPFLTRMGLPKCKHPAPPNRQLSTFQQSSGNGKVRSTCRRCRTSYLSGGVLDNKALIKPAATYSDIARRNRVSGIVGASPY